MKNKGRGGFIDILALIGVAIVIIIIPFATGAIKQNQDVRQQAYEACIYGTRCSGDGNCGAGEFCDNGCCEVDNRPTATPQPIPTPTPETRTDCGWGGFGSYACANVSDCVQCQNDGAGNPISAPVGKENCGPPCGVDPSATPTPVVTCIAAGGCWNGAKDCCGEDYDDSNCASGVRCGSPPNTPTPTVPTTITPTPTTACTSSGCPAYGENCCGNSYFSSSCPGGTMCGNPPPTATPTTRTTPTATPKPVCTSSGCPAYGENCCGNSYFSSSCPGGTMCGNPPPTATPTTRTTPTATPKPVCTSSGCPAYGENCCGNSYFSSSCPGGTMCGNPPPTATPTTRTTPTATPKPVCTSSGCPAYGENCCGNSYFSSSCPGGTMCGNPPPTSTPTTRVSPTATPVPACVPGGGCLGDGARCCGNSYFSSSCPGGTMCGNPPPTSTPTTRVSPTATPVPACVPGGGCLGDGARCCGNSYFSSSCPGGTMCGNPPPTSTPTTRTTPTITPKPACVSSGCPAYGEICCGGGIASMLCPGGTICSGPATTITPSPTLIPTFTPIPTYTPTPILTPTGAIPAAYNSLGSQLAVQSAIARGLKPLLVYPGSGDPTIENLYRALRNNTACGAAGCLMMTNEDSPLTAVLPGYPNVVIISAPLISDPYYSNRPNVINAIMDHEKVHTQQTANAGKDFSDSVHCPQDKCHLFQGLIEGQAESVSPIGGEDYRVFRTIWAKTKEWAQNTGNSALFAAVATGHDAKIDELVGKMEQSGLPLSKLLTESGWK